MASSVIFSNAADVQARLLLLLRFVRAIWIRLRLNWTHHLAGVLFAIEPGALVLRAHVSLAGHRLDQTLVFHVAHQLHAWHIRHHLTILERFLVARGNSSSIDFLARVGIHLVRELPHLLLLTSYSNVVEDAEVFQEVVLVAVLGEDFEDAYHLVVSVLDELVEERNGGVLDHAKHRVLAQDLVLVLHDTLNVFVVALVLCVRVDVGIIISAAVVVSIVGTSQRLLRRIPHLVTIVTGWNHWRLMHWQLDLVGILILIHTMVVHHLVRLIFGSLVASPALNLVSIAVTHVTIVVRGTIVNA